MRSATLILALFFAVPALAEESTANLLKSLEEVDAVAGKRVGYGGGQSRFHRLFTLLRFKNDEFTIRGLTADERPLFRAMGLVLTVDRESTDAIPMLRERLRDRGAITVFPRGCVGTQTTVGGLARSLLGNANYIADDDRQVPLLSPAELTALDLEILIRNDTDLIHAPAASGLRATIREGRLALDLKALRKLSPERNDTLLIRGIGRLVPEDTGAADENVIGFLATVAANESHHDHVRLAAASGISRGTTEMSRKALAPLRAGIRKAGGKEIFERWVRRARLLDKVRWKAGKEKAAAIRHGDPAALPVLRSIADRVRCEDGKWPKWVGPAFLALTARVERGFEVWDTRSDFPRELSRFMKEHRGELGTLIGRERWRDVSDRLGRLRAR